MEDDSNRIKLLDTIQEELGNGTYGTVYKKDKYAVKRFKFKDTSFISEVTALVNLKHPNIVKLIAVSSQDNVPEITLELALSSLEDIIENVDAPYLGYQLVRAVAYCHSMGIAHCDIKPANILVFKNKVIKLADFGLARFQLFKASNYTFDETDTHFLPGATLWYRSPEEVLEEKTNLFSLDNWSVGCVLAEMINHGYPLFVSASEQGLLQRISNVTGSEFTYTPQLDITLEDVHLLEAGEKSIKDFLKPLPVHIKCQVKRPRLTKFKESIVHEFLQVDVKKRLTCLEAIHHKYFENVRKDIDKLYPEPIKNRNVVDTIHAFEDTLSVKTNNDIINHRMRDILVDWLYEIREKFQLNLQTYYLAVHLVDKFVGTLPVPRNEYQLFGCTSLYLASCIYETTLPPNFNNYVYMSDNSFTESEMSIAVNLMFTTFNNRILYSTLYDYFQLYKRHFTSQVNDLVEKYMLTFIKKYFGLDVFNNTSYAYIIVALYLQIPDTRPVFDELFDNNIPKEFLRVASVLKKYPLN